MRRLISFILLVLSSQTSDAAETLRNSLWRVTSVERNSIPSEDFTGTESIDGRLIATFTLHSIQFSRDSLTLTLASPTVAGSGQELSLQTSRLPAAPAGRFRTKLLGKQTEICFSIANSRLVLSVIDSDQPLVISAEPYHQRSGSLQVDQ